MPILNVQPFGGGFSVYWKEGLLLDSPLSHHPCPTRPSKQSFWFTQKCLQVKNSFNVHFPSVSITFQSSHFPSILVSLKTIFSLMILRWGSLRYFGYFQQDSWFKYHSPSLHRNLLHFKSSLYYFVSVCLWINHLSYMNFSFLICKIRIITVPILQYYMWRL